jgi:LysM repeat protein
VNSPHSHRRPPKIRRTGRHAKPSQVQNVAGTAYKAAPAMAIAGALIAAPSAQAATPAAAAGTATVAGQTYSPAQAPAQAPAAVAQARTDALVVHHEPARHYTVRPGDTLTSIAQRFYGSPARWTWLFQANRSVIKNPDVIFAGEVLDVPFEAPAAGQAAPPAAPPPPPPPAAAATPTALTTSTTLSGTLNCHGLEELWDEAGGSPAEAFMAAEIAMAESSGQQFATGPFGERGYWQINPNHGSLSTYDPLGNAKSAIIISSDGTNWNPWTTFITGAYQGRC